MQTRSLLAKTFILLLIAGSSFTATAQKVVKVLQNADTLITKNTTWDCDTIYFLKGKVYVTNAAELTIQPGTVIVGDTISKGALLITKGSKIHAVGTPSCPIVFTSAKGPNKRNRGDWGGLIILGKAAVNTPTGTANIEGLPPSALTEYGGGLNPVNNDNSGELNFVRVEYAGVAFAPNNEINGITFGGVGSGTLIDYVQVSYANDDSFEWFGGTVNCKHLIAFRGIDDDFDTDNGFSGKLQFGIGLRDSLVADISGSKAFESDNDANGSANLPQTRAIFSNFTCSAGGDTTNNINFKDAAHIRRNSHMYLYNSIVMGFPDGINLDGTLTQGNVTADTMVANNIIGTRQVTKEIITSSPSGATAVIDLLQNHASNRYYSGNAGILLTAPYNMNKPDFRPAAGSPALTGTNFNHVGLNDPFFTKTTYVGAVNKAKSQNWAQTWTNFTPNKTTYGVACACSLAGPATNADFFAAVAEEVATDKADISVYPNPAHNSFKVNIAGFSGNINVKVVNMNGVTVYSKQTVATAKSVLDVTLNKAVPGFYFVSVTDGNNTVTKKLNVIQ